MPAAQEPTKPTIVGRSSSHFTRVTRMFAAELEVDHAFRVVRDIQSSDVDDYGGNPALKLPSLITPSGTWFGSINVCRQLARSSERPLHIVWPEALDRPLPANAQELVIHGMSTAVTLLMGKAAGATEDAHRAKMRTSLLNSVSWLESNADEAIAALPTERDLSFLEVTLYCFVTHLKFREVLATDSYQRLNRFCERFGARPSAQATSYRFDV